MASLARRWEAPYPALVALAGVGLALFPDLPPLALDPHLALALFVAPVLVDAAFEASQRDLRVHWGPVASLALGAVTLTVVLVALVARALVPGLPWGAAIVLGAIVAPPDAAAASTVLKALRPPNRLLVILEGESLFNDASALLIYRLAVMATLTGTLSGWSILPTFLVVTVGSLLLGLVLSALAKRIARNITELPTAFVFQFCGTVSVWLLAEGLHLSGIITTVVYGMSIGRHAPTILPARLRVPSWAVWEVVVFILNVLAFILVGFQLKSLSPGTGRAYLGVTVAVLLTAVVARALWVWCATTVRRWRRGSELVISKRESLVAAWCGMRGTVTLAAALALPANFPFRDLILVSSFGVVLGTLVIQGLTLRPLLLYLKLEDDGTVEKEVHTARVEGLKAALASLEAQPPSRTLERLVEQFKIQLVRAEGECTEDAADLAAERVVEADLLRACLQAQRDRLIALRDDGSIGEDAFRVLQEELDWTELGWSHFLRIEV